MTASALKTFRRNWIHRGGNDVSGNIIALANMSFRAGTPYPSMPVLNNVVRCLTQGYASLTLGCLTLAAPVYYYV